MQTLISNIPLTNQVTNTFTYHLKNEMALLLVSIQTTCYITFLIEIDGLECYNKAIAALVALLFFLLLLMPAYYTFFFLTVHLTFSPPHFLSKNKWPNKILKIYNCNIFGREFSVPSVLVYGPIPIALCLILDLFVILRLC